MAALTRQIVVAAADARREARALRRRAHAGRVEMRRRVADVERRQEQCLLAYRGMGRARSVGQRSPWSDLPWRYPDRDLDLTLVPVAHRPL